MILASNAEFHFSLQIVLNSCEGRLLFTLQASYKGKLSEHDGQTTTWRPFAFPFNCCIVKKNKRSHYLAVSAHMHSHLSLSLFNLYIILRMGGKKTVQKSSIWQDLYHCWSHCFTIVCIPRMFMYLLRTTKLNSRTYMMRQGIILTTSVLIIPLKH